MSREEIIERLKEFKVVPGHGTDYSHFTDKQLKLRLELFENMSMEADKALNK